MPINNPRKINKAEFRDSEEAPVCRECALRLVDGDVDELRENFSKLGKVARLQDCVECKAFAARRHPAMFSQVRTIQEIEAEIASQRLLLAEAQENEEEDQVIEHAKAVDVLEWVLGIGRHSNTAEYPTGVKAK